MKYFDDRPGNVRELDRPLSSSSYEAHDAPVLTTVGVRLSVAMAAHNEERTIAAAIEQVLAVRGEFELELIVVDDGSSDATSAIIETFDDPRLRTIRHPACRGKGAAIMSAAAVATGTHLLVFDADLEYAASDIPSLVDPVISGRASIVYGSRIRGSRTSFPSFIYALGAKATTVFANMAFNAWMSDMHTCLKLMPLQLFRQLELSEFGFGLDTEITCEVLRRGLRPYEVPCSYRGRSFAEGKQISTRDGFECLKVVVEVRLRGRLDYSSAVVEPLHVLVAADDAGVVPAPLRRLTDAGQAAVTTSGSLFRRGRVRRDAVLYASGGDSKAI